MIEESFFVFVCLFSVFCFCFSSNSLSPLFVQNKLSPLMLESIVHPGGGYSTLGWVRMCGPKFRPPPYNKTREDANLQPITKPFASWRTLFKTNQYFLPYKLGCISTFWQPIGKLKGKIQWKLCILQKCDLYLINQFSNKKGAIGKPERPKKHPIWAPHPRTHLSTKYPPPGLYIINLWYASAIYNHDQVHTVFHHTHTTPTPSGFHTVHIVNRPTPIGYLILPLQMLTSEVWNVICSSSIRRVCATG